MWLVEPIGYVRSQAGIINAKVPIHIASNDRRFRTLAQFNCLCFVSACDKVGIYHCCNVQVSGSFEVVHCKQVNWCFDLELLLASHHGSTRRDKSGELVWRQHMRLEAHVLRDMRAFVTWLGIAG